MNRRSLTLLLLVATTTAASGAGWPRREHAAAPPARPHDLQPPAADARVTPRSVKPMVAIERYTWSEDPPRIVSDGADSVDLAVTVSCTSNVKEGAKVR